MYLMSFDKMSGFNLKKNINTISAVLDIGSDKIICLIAKIPFLKTTGKNLKFLVWGTINPVVLNTGV